MTALQIAACVLAPLGAAAGIWGSWQPDATFATHVWMVTAWLTFVVVTWAAVWRHTRPMAGGG